METAAGQPTQIEGRFETKQPSIEQRVLLLEPAKFPQSLFTRRQRYAELTSGKASAVDSQERQRLEREIQVLVTRARELESDSSAPNLETVREKQQEIGRRFAELDQGGNQDYFVRAGLQIRLGVLERRAAALRNGGPIINTLERRIWKAQDYYNGEPLPPEKWEQVSPRLKDNPDAELDEQEELNWYIKSLSVQRRKEVRSLTEQMKPLDDSARAVVCMPAYNEGVNIYRTLVNFVGQKEVDGKPFDYRKVRIVVLDNWPEGTVSDNTREEVGRLMAYAREVCPGLQIDYIRGTFSSKVQTIGNIRNMATAAIIDNAVLNRRKPVGDLVYISNDADMTEQAIKPTYLADVIKEFDTHPRMDALAGKIDMPERLMARVPVQLATRRLWQYMDTITIRKTSKEPFLVGRNSAMRLKMVAAVGNYDPANGAGEDVEIGNKIKAVRSWDKQRNRFDRARIRSGKLQEGNRVRYVNKISMDTDPRRDIVMLLYGKRIKDQYKYRNFERHEGVRGKHGDQLVEMATQKNFDNFNRTTFELEAGQLYYDSVWEDKNGAQGRIAVFRRAMALLGARYEVVNGKFRLIDTSLLESKIKLLQFRQFHQKNVEHWMSTPFRRVNTLSGGANNQVLEVQTADGRDLILRTSGQDRNKFASERWAIQQLAQKGLPVPRIVAADSSRRVIPKRTISIQERLPGESLQRSYYPGEVNSEFLRQVGAALKSIHEVEISDGYGYLKENGVGEKKSWDEFVMEPFESSRFSRLLDSKLVGSEDIAAAVAFAQGNRKFLSGVPRQLLHGDFTLGNILQKNNTLTGILDFENAKSGDPLWDIAQFMVYENARVGGEKGFTDLLAGYGRTDLLTTPEFRVRYNLYRLSNILYGLHWYSYQPHRQNDIKWLNSQLKEVLRELGSGNPRTSGEILRSPETIAPIGRDEINGLLRKRFDKAVEWFRDFYKKGVPNDQEFLTGKKKYEELRPVIETALKDGNDRAKNDLFSALKKDPLIAGSGFSDQEIQRQVDRLIAAYKSNPAIFSTIDTQNPAFRALVYLRNRGKLARYEGEYAHLPKEVNFRNVVMNLAREKSLKGEVMNILDEGGTFDVALQQLSGAIKYHVPKTELKLASTAADNMAVEFGDCHKVPVDHRMADAHGLNETFSGEKRTLIISQAAYKFFWDPVGAIVESANALEKGGWAFLGDIRDKTSYKLFEMFRDENGNPSDPQKVFSTLNGLNLGYKFYTGMHTSMRDGEPRQVMTLAIQKETDKDLKIPMFYGRAPKNPKESDWISPLVYLFPSATEIARFGRYTRVGKR